MIYSPVRRINSGRYSYFFIFIAAIIVMAVLFFISQIVVSLMARSGVFPTAETQAVVRQIIPDTSCNNKSCSTDYNVTMLDVNGHPYYTTYYSSWDIPAIGQVVTVRYMTTHNFLFHEKVVDVK